MISTSADYYEAIVTTASDYYPFGWSMPNRKFNTHKYSYGFNGQIQDPEWMGGQSVAFEARIYESRLGRWLSVDPITHPWQSPYSGIDNSPIWKSDPDGKHGRIRIIPNKDGKGGKIIITTTVHVYGEKSKEYLEVMNADTYFNDLNGSYTDEEGNIWNISFDVSFKHSEKALTIDQIPEGDNILATHLGKGRSHIYRKGKEKAHKLPFSGFRKGDKEILIDPSENFAEFIKQKEFYESRGWKFFEEVRWQNSAGRRGNIYESNWAVYKEYLFRHEIFHNLGLSDRYMDLVSKYGHKYSKSHKGFENDIMAKNSEEFSQTHFNNLGSWIVEKYRKVKQTEFILNKMVDRTLAKDGINIELKGAVAPTSSSSGEGNAPNTNQNSPSDSCNDPCGELW